MAMTIHAIADLHLDSGGKPMDVFGERWANHAERIFANWRERVSEHDLVLIPGDISWAMQLQEAREHLRQIGELPGEKLILRGNHDYWWGSIGRVRDALPARMYALQNDSFAFGEVVIAGSRGWMLPQDGGTPDDVKIYERELIRLRISMEDARRRQPQAPMVVMMHFPPLTQEDRDTGFVRLLHEYGAKACAYGHLHGASLHTAVRGHVDGVKYVQVSSDGIDFCPVAICEA